MSSALSAPHEENWWEVYSATHRSDEENPDYHLGVLKINNERVIKAKWVGTSEIWAKRIGFVAALAINLALLAGIGLLIFYYSPSFLPTSSPLPFHAIIASPFIGGVIAALLSLKLTKFKTNDSGFQNDINPISLLGRVMTLVLFGPLLYMKYKIDWRDYSDPYVVNAVSFDLGTQSLEKITLKYGGSISTLRRSGIITKKEAIKLKEMTGQFQPLIKNQNFFKAVWNPKNIEIKEEDDDSPRMHTTEEKEMVRLEALWEEYRKSHVKNRAFTPLQHPGRVRKIIQMILEW